MKVTGPGGPSAPAARKQAGRSKGDFRLGEEPARETAAPASATPLAAIDALVALQADAGDASQKGRGQAFARAEGLLELLDSIRLGLLVGAIPKARLLALSQAVANRRAMPSDPALERIIREIELRAKVEIAKLDTAS